jgi:hypothetical protein
MNADGTVKDHQKISATSGNFSGRLDFLGRFGSSVAHLGDLDGDGITELAVGAVTQDDGGMDRGALWLLYLDQDHDRDGIPGAIENAGPAGGDGNNDSIPDSEQTHVATLPNAVDGTYVTLEAFDGSTPPSIDLVNVLASASAAVPPPPGVTLPLGVFSFEIQGVTAGAMITVEMTLHGPIVPPAYYKFGTEPGDPQEHWWEFDFDGTTGAEVNGNVITLMLVDGGRGDADGLANGIIADPGGPASFSAALDGDYNGNTQVEQGDLDLVLLNWGRDASPLPEAWVDDLPEGQIDQDELDTVLLNWGASLAAFGSVAPALLPLDRADATEDDPTSIPVHVDAAYCEYARNPSSRPLSVVGLASPLTARF